MTGEKWKTNITVIVMLGDIGEGSWAGATQRRVLGRGRRLSTRKATSSAAPRSSPTAGSSLPDTVSTSQFKLLHHRHFN